MTGHLARALACERPGRVPYVPAVYEQKAWFAGTTPSRACRNAALFIQGVMAEFEQLQPDALVVGTDVYNVEAEAIGCPVTYYEGDDTSIPAIPAGAEIYHEGESVRALPVPDPRRDGRMPLNIEVAAAVRAKVPPQIPVRGALSGPFSLAASLAGPENLFTMVMTDPGTAQELLAFAARVIVRYGKEFLKAHCGVILFDSQASPELLSPAAYRELVLPVTHGIIDEFQKAGVRHVPLIIGGNTTPMLDPYLATGANNLLCDAKADPHVFLKTCSAHRRAYRRNLDSSEFLTVTPEEMRRRALRELEIGGRYPGFILGTGVVPYGTPVATLVAVREAIEEFEKKVNSKTPS